MLISVCISIIWDIHGDFRNCTTKRQLKLELQQNTYGSMAKVSRYNRSPDRQALFCSKVCLMVPFEVPNAWYSGPTGKVLAEKLPVGAFCPRKLAPSKSTTRDQREKQAGHLASLPWWHGNQDFIRDIFRMNGQQSNMPQHFQSKNTTIFWLKLTETVENMRFRMIHRVWIKK